MTTAPAGLSPGERARQLVEQGRAADALKVLTSAEADLTADELYFAGRLSLMNGNATGSLVWIAAARDAFAADGDNLAALRTDLGRVNVLADLARFHEAAEVAERLSTSLDEVAAGVSSEEEEELAAWLRCAALENLGAIFGFQGRHAEAVATLEAAADLYAASSASPMDLARVRANLGVERLETGAVESAIEDLVWARERFAEDPEQWWLAYRCMVIQGNASALLGRYGHSLSLLEAADDKYAGPVSDDSPDALRARLVRTEVLVALNLLQDAVEALQNLQPLLRDREMLLELAQSERNLSLALLGSGDTDNAAAACERAISLYDELDLSIRSAGARVTLARCLNETDGCLEVDAALDMLETTTEVRRIAEAALAGADLAFDGPTRRRYLDRADAAGALATGETAWQSLWHRSELVSDPSSRSSLLDRALETLSSLRGDLVSDRQRAPFMASRRDPLEARIALHLDADEHLDAFELSTAHRAWSLHEAADPNPTGSGVLPLTDTTLLYQSIGDHLWCFVTNPTVTNPTDDAALRVVDLGEAVPKIQHLLRRLRAEWRHLADLRLRVHVSSFQPVVDGILGELYEAVFAPVEEHIHTERIIVVPTGRLAAVPFAALHDGVRNVIDRYEVSTAASVPTHVLPPANDGYVLSVGVPDQLAPRIGIEAEQIAQLTSGRLLLGKDATAATVQALTPDACTIHLAGHSTFQAENPLLSAFKFADRDVPAAEIASWDLCGKTIVLASCSSGRQSNVGEDELLGLPRALLLAGARDIIMNLWEVDDVASVGLMSQFHQHLGSSTPSGALRQAQLVTRDIHEHPYFWASPVHYQHPWPSSAAVIEESS